MIPVSPRDEVTARLSTLLDVSLAEQRVVGALVLRIENLQALLLSRGFATADAILLSVEQRLATVARPRDWCARIGDRDFLLLAPGLRSAAQMQLAASKLLRALAEPVLIGSDALPLHARIGIACGPEHGGNAADLLLSCERALHQAEQRNESVATYVTAAGADPQSDWRIEELFDAAFEQGEFELWYQPKYRLADRRLIGAEALTRWNSSHLGPISPARFVAIAERCGKIDRLTWSSINTALQQKRQWADPSLSLAINLSAVCLQSDDLVGRIRSALGLWAADSAKLIVEITESAVMQNPEASLRKLDELRSLGVRVSIDDFGTGQSSLAYFKLLPATEIKIDRSFIMNIRSDAADRHIVQSIVELAHRLGLEVVAEGIEDADTARLLTELGCDIGQGYHFSRPVPAAEFSRLITDQPLPATPLKAVRG